MIDIAGTASSSGSSRSPDSVGETPLTTCMNSGRIVIGPSIAPPTTKPSAPAARNTRLRNSDSGNSGSRARRSTSTNAHTSTTPAANAPAIGRDIQGYTTPPNDVASTRQVVAAAINAAP